MKETIEWSDAATGKVALIEETDGKKAKERKEGGGIWNRSRAPHCYGYEYEKHFGHVCKLGIISKEHEALWRKSSHWPNVPPVDEFYSDHKSFENGCYDLFYKRAVARAKKELEERKRKKREYEIAYNVIRRNRRRKRAKEKRRRIEEYSNKQIHY